MSNRSDLAPAKRALWLQILVLPLLNPAINALFVEHVVTALRQFLLLLGFARTVADTAVKKRRRLRHLLDFLATLYLNILMLVEELFELVDELPVLGLEVLHGCNGQHVAVLRL